MSKRLLTFILSTLVLASCASVRHTETTVSSARFPKIRQNGKTAVVAHRGFWNCEEGGMSENSIASLKAAQDNHFWGSELDIHITADDKLIVNHDGVINGKKIEKSNFADFDSDLLPNGEKRPSLDEYLIQGAKCKTTVLVIELKSSGIRERDDIFVDKTLEALKAHRMYSPKRVAFISFSKYICDRIAAKAPGFINQYLNGELSPASLADDGINGLDYHEGAINRNKEWVSGAHALGMSVNVWTVDKEDAASSFIDLGVDAITTNKPLMVRNLLGEKEYRR